MRGRCPAHEKTCRACGSKSHFERKCPVKSVRTVETDFDQQEMRNYSSVGEVSVTDSGRSGLMLINLN